MREIETIDYYIYVNKNGVGLGEYDSLEDLISNAKEYITNLDEKIGKSTAYIGIGANFFVIDGDKKEDFGALDFVNRKIGCEKFSFCKDAEKLNIEIPSEVKDGLKTLIDIL